MAESGNPCGTRASPEDVQAIIDFDPSIANLCPFLTVANQLVTEICQPVSTYPYARLFEIERWLAAHFLAVRDPRYLSESIGAASASRQGGQMGMNLSLTPYGQQALLLDTAGGLADLDKHIAQGHRPKAGILHLGDRAKLERWAAYPWQRFWASGW